MTDNQTASTNKLPAQSLNQLFHQARTFNTWQDKEVTDDLITEIYDLVKLMPTSANCSPARFIFIKTPASKALLEPALSSGNIDKTMSAPVTVIVAYDTQFFEKLPQLFPYADAKSWFTSSPEMAEETAFRNASMQAAYLIMACRSLGLDTGPMSGFTPSLIDDTFLANTQWKSSLLVNIGYGSENKPYKRLPRLGFDEVCKII